LDEQIIRQTLREIEGEMIGEIAQEAQIIVPDEDAEQMVERAGRKLWEATVEIAREELALELENLKSKLQKISL